MKEVNRWRMSIDHNGDEPNVYPVLDGEGDWVDYTCYELVERRNRELDEELKRSQHFREKHWLKISELEEKLSALAGVIVDLKK